MQRLRVGSTVEYSTAEFPRRLSGHVPPQVHALLVDRVAHESRRARPPASTLLRPAPQPLAEDLTRQTHVASEVLVFPLLLHLHLLVQRKLRQLHWQVDTVHIYPRQTSFRFRDSRHQAAAVCGCWLFLPPFPRARVDAPAPLNQKPLLVPQHSRQAPKPVEDLDVVVADVASVAQEASCSQGDYRHHRVHTCDEEGLVPGQIRQRLVARTKVLQVPLRVHAAVGGVRRASPVTTL